MTKHTNGLATDIYDKLYDKGKKARGGQIPVTSTQLDRMQMDQFIWLVEQRDLMAQQLRNANVRLHDINKLLYQMCESMDGHDFDDGKHQTNCIDCGMENPRGEEGWDEEEPHGTSA